MDVKSIELSADRTTAFCACLPKSWAAHNFKITKAFIKSCSTVINYSESILVFVKQSFTELYFFTCLFGF